MDRVPHIESNSVANDNLIGTIASLLLLVFLKNVFAK